MRCSVVWRSSWPGGGRAAGPSLHAERGCVEGGFAGQSVAAFDRLRINVLCILRQIPWCIIHRTLMRSASRDVLPASVLRSLRKLGADLGAARRRRSLTAEMMAERLGISRSTWHRVEAGDSA